MQYSQVFIFACLIFAAICTVIASCSGKEGKQEWVLYAIEILLVGILICLNEIAWGSV